MGNLHILNGSAAGCFFELKEGANYIGRSRENDVQIDDETVSRRHLKILKKSEKYFLTDLGSQNRTFFNGNYLIPGIEVPIRKGIPIAIGMTMIGIDDPTGPQMPSLLASMGLTKVTANNSGLFTVHKEMTNQKKLELVYKVTDLLQQSLPKKDTLEILLDAFFEILGKIERAAFILVRPGTSRIGESISKSKGTADRVGSGSYEKIVSRVVNAGKPLIINDALIQETEDELAPTLRLENIASVMCIPMMSFSEPVGAIYMDSLSVPYPFAEEDVILFEHIANRTATFLLS